MSDKIHELFSIYDFLIVNYAENMKAEGWVVGYSYLENTNYPIRVYCSVGSDIDDDCQIDNIQQAYKQAVLHGLILNSQGDVLGLNKEQFEKTLYLWQAQDLGIL